MRAAAAVALAACASAASPASRATEGVAWRSAARAPGLEREQDLPDLSSADSAAWWGQGAAASGPTESAAELERMSSLLRRQLQDGAYSYLFSEGPSTLPSPIPSPMPSPVPTSLGGETTVAPTPGCEDGESLYTLALYDFGEDGWEGATYTVTDASGDSISEGTLESGGEGTVSFCAVDGTYTLAFGGGSDDSETSVQFLPEDSMPTTDQTGPSSFSFTSAGGSVELAVVEPTGRPVPAPTGRPVPAPTVTPGSPTNRPVPAPTASPLATTAPVPAPTPQPVDVVVPDPVPAPTASPPAPTAGSVPAPTAGVGTIGASPTPASENPGFAAGSATAAPAGVSTSKKSSEEPTTASGTFIGVMSAVAVLVLLLCFLLVYAYQTRERKLTERKDSWDISTMFTDEANLPDAEEMIDVEPESAAGVAPAALVEGEGGALTPLDEDQPQALQKITQAAEL